MNANIKILIGAVVGGTIGYFVGGIAYDFVETIQKAKECQDTFEDQEMPRPEELDPEGEKEPQIVNKHRLRKAPEKKVPIRNYAEYFQSRPDIAALAAKYKGDGNPGETIDGVPDSTTADISEAQQAEMKFETYEPESEEKDGPHIIPFEQYVNSDSGFEKIHLQYYDDDVVTDDQDEPIKHPEKLIGEDALVSFGELSNDPDIVYVKNIDKQAEYEVVRLNKTYAPTKPEPKPRRRNRAEKDKKEDGES
jgi:hypothetical protein